MQHALAGKQPLGNVDFNSTLKRFENFEKAKQEKLVKLKTEVRLRYRSIKRKQAKNSKSNPKSMRRPLPKTEFHWQIASTPSSQTSSTNQKVSKNRWSSRR